MIILPQPIQYWCVQPLLLRFMSFSSLTATEQNKVRMLSSTSGFRNQATPEKMTLKGSSRVKTLVRS